MSLFTLLFRRKRPKKSEKTEQTEKAEEHSEEPSSKNEVPKSIEIEEKPIQLPASNTYFENPSSRLQTNLQQTQLQNRDFIYGVGYGYFKSDFDDIKDRLRKIQEELINGHSLILGKTEEHSEEHRAILDQLGENRKKLGILVEKAEQYSAQPSIPTELSEDLKQKVEAATLSLRQAEIYNLVKKVGHASPKDISSQLNIAENTATEHLRNLEKLGLLVRVSRGLYRANENSTQTPEELLTKPSPGASEQQDEA